MNGFKKIGEKIKYYREKQGLDKKLIAKYVGISENRYEEIENGQAIYNFSTLEKIANLLKISLPELLNFD